MKRLTITLALMSILTSCTPKNQPAPYGAVPHPRQLAWHDMQYYAFVHFGPNTFTDREWGYGDEDESVFNPGELDCRQWARAAKDAGMNGIIITAKHHDGFCLWPSAYTEHSVKNSPWRDGRGDVIRELRDACDEYGLKLGVYLSPWDRNHAAYGTPAYLDYYRSQLRELLTNYGEVFEVWFDGAMGGDGYYGGARETRRIDNRTYYDWANTIPIVRELQPGACMFSDGGPDVRWVGNEQGYAAETNWCTMNRDHFYPGVGGVNEVLQHGQEDGSHWLPAEVNTSIRPGWFYHASQDDQVKSLEKLIDIWFHSVGMNGNFILNVPPDRRGLFHEIDVQRLKELRAWLDRAFADDLARRATVTASSVREGSRKYEPASAVDGDPATCWAVNDGITNASITLTFPEPVECNTVTLREYIALGQRVKAFTIEAEAEGRLTPVSQGTTVGNRRIVRFDPVTTRTLRITITAKACPLISTIEVYKTPPVQTTGGT
ncbi:alpha-L-fucosidase [bacterium]|nr:alpha-L-fucosidase [bacterium]